MSIFARINYKNIKGDKTLFSLFLFWLTFCVITVFAFYYRVSALSHVDVPTHLGAGLVIAAFVYSTIRVKSGREALSLCFIPFFLWEFIEVGIAGITHDPFLDRLFTETLFNQTQDVAMDTLGFLVFMIMTGRRF